jgi:hypothetical protein
LCVRGGTSKATLEHYSRALAKELGGRGITVNTIAPGALDTPFFYAAETRESVDAIKHFTGGLGGVDDVVPTVEFLLKPGARWLLQPRPPGQQRLGPAVPFTAAAKTAHTDSRSPRRARSMEPASTHGH